MTSSNACIPQPRRIKMAPSLESTCLVSRKHPSHHARRLEAERSVMAWTRDKRREGPRAMPHEPAPRTQHGALCFCFCQLFSARKRHRELGARWARRQSSGCRADKVPRWYRERERKLTLSSEEAD